MPRTEGRSDRESYKGTVIRETEKAWLFDADTLDDGPIWLPRSQCTWVPDSAESDQTLGGGGWMMVPDWLAREKGLA